MENYKYFTFYTKPRWAQELKNIEYTVEVTKEGNILIYDGDIKIWDCHEDSKIDSIYDVFYNIARGYLFKYFGVDYMTYTQKLPSYLIDKLDIQLHNVAFYTERRVTRLVNNLSKKLGIKISC